MTKPFRRHAHFMLVPLAVIALVAAGCSGSGATTQPTKAPTNAAPATNGNGNATQQPSDNGQATDQPNASNPFSGAKSNFSKIESYRFKMTMQGPSFDSLTGLLGGTSGAAFEMSGTVVTKPDKAAYVKMGAIEMIEIGSKSYIKMGSSWMDGGSSGTSGMADSFAPDKMFGDMSSGVTGDGVSKVGDETKNGVAATHYKVDSQLVGSSLGTAFGLESSATWAYDAWIAKDGGYPVSMSIVGSADGKTVAKMVFEITNVNDPANKVTAPI